MGRAGLAIVQVGSGSYVCAEDSSLLSLSLVCEVKEKFFSRMTRVARVPRRPA